MRRCFSFFRIYFRLYYPFHSPFSAINVEAVYPCTKVSHEGKSFKCNLLELFWFVMKQSFMYEGSPRNCEKVYLSIHSYNAGGRETPAAGVDAITNDPSVSRRPQTPSGRLTGPWVQLLGWVHSHWFVGWHLSSRYHDSFHLSLSFQLSKFKP